MNSNIFAAVAAEARRKLATKQELDTLRELQASWKWASDTARSSWMDGMLSTVLTGKLNHQAEEDCLNKGQSAREKMREVTAAALPVARKVASRFAEAAHRVAISVERSEVHQFSRFGVNHSPSALLQTLRKLPDQARARIPSSEWSSTSPAEMLPFLNLNNRRHHGH